MNVETMRDLKTQIEQEIQSLVAARVNTFNQLTGLLVTDVEINMRTFSGMGEYKQTVFEGVTLHIHIPPGDRV